MPLRVTEGHITMYLSCNDEECFYNEVGECDRAEDVSIREGGGCSERKVKE